MTVFSPDLPEEEIQGTIDRVVGYITTASGEMGDVSRDSPWGRRRLAYAIRHGGRDVRDGFYTLYHFQIAPHRVDDVERELKLNDRVMRYLLTQYTPKPVEEVAPSPEEATEAAAEGVAEEAPAEAVEPAAATAATEAPAGDGESAAEPEAAAAPEPVDDAAEVVESTAPRDEEADTDEATPPEEV
jgi:small subunit ribosomal protein S6